MKNLKIVQDSEIQDWVEDIFKKNSFNMIDVSSKNETFRRALASGKIYVGNAHGMELTSTGPKLIRTINTRGRY